MPSRLQIVGADAVVVDLHFFVRCGGVTVDLDAHVAAAAKAERHPRREARGFDSRQFSNPRQQVQLELHGRAAASYPAGSRSIDARIPLRVENPGSTDCAFARVRRNRPAETSRTSDSATCATTSALPQTCPSRCGGDRRRRFLQCRHHRTGRAVERRHQSEDQCRWRRHTGGEQQHRSVELGIHRDRQRRRWNEQPHEILRPVREGDSGDAAQAGQQACFRSATAAPAAAPAGAEGEPHRRFTLASGGAGQQQVGDVRAGDQQHDCGDACWIPITPTTAAPPAFGARHNGDSFTPRP